MLSEEAEKLRQILKENELSADEDKYLLNKMAEDCGHLTKENSLLHAQIQKVTKHLNQVGLICSSDSNLEKSKRNYKKISVQDLFFISY